jgi:inner membrane transporter RhtA
VLLALLPVTATVVGLVALAQVPGPAEALGIAAVVAAVALRSRDGDPPARAAPVTERDTGFGNVA